MLEMLDEIKNNLELDRHTFIIPKAGPIVWNLILTMPVIRTTVQWIISIGVAQRGKALLNRECCLQTSGLQSEALADGMHFGRRAC